MALLSRRAALRAAAGFAALRAGPRALLPLLRALGQGKAALKAAAAEAANASMGIAANASPAPPTATDEGAPTGKPSVVKAEGEAATVDGADNAAQPQVQQDAEGDVKMEER